MAVEENVDDTIELLFFLGAGASVPAGIKHVVMLVDDLVNWFDSNNSQFSKITREIIQIIREWEKNRNIEGYLNIETLLETVERLEVSFDDVLPNFFKDRTLKLNEEQTKLIKDKTLSEEIKNFIQISFHKIKDIKYYLPLNEFVSNYSPIYAFTTNYDMIIEQFCEKSRKKYSDLFKGSEWSPEIPNPLEFDLILHKLHGSINWYRTERGRYIKAIEKTTKTEIELFNNEKAVPLILYPGKKLEYIEPTLEMLNMLKKTLLKVKCSFVVGYSFKDEHLSKLFLYSARNNQRLVVFLVTPSAHTIYYERLKRYSDKDFPHGFMHESFEENDFDVTIPSDLEGRVICLPYKIQNIFPKLLNYYENLKKGLDLERALKAHKGKIDPLAVIMGGGDSNSFNLIDCLICFSDCEYFEKIEEIVQSRTDGWDSIINKMAKVQHFSEKITFVLDFFLKSYFNYWSSHRKVTFVERLLKYLTMMKNSIKISIKNYSIRLTFQLSGAELDGYLGYKFHEYLETQFSEYQKISEIDDKDILRIIQNGKNFFNKWRNGEIELKHYIQYYITDESTKEKLTNLIKKIELSHSPAETKVFENDISDIITKIEAQHN